MKSLNEYLINEFKLTRDYKKPKQIIEVPGFDVYEDEWSDSTVSLDITNIHKYVVYKDKYRGDLPHFASFFDMLSNICLFYDDYEGFNPKTDILYSSDDPQDILNWYNNNYISKNKHVCDSGGQILSWLEDSSNIENETDMALCDMNRIDEEKYLKDILKQYLGI